MKSKLFLMAIAIVSVTILTVSAQPRRMQPGSGLRLQAGRQAFRAEGFNMPLGNLDEKQREELQKIRTIQLKESTQFRNLLREKQARLETLQTADKPDMRDINKVIDEIAAIQGQEMKARAANRQKIRSLLTEEQRVRFDAMGADRENRRSGMVSRPSSIGRPDAGYSRPDFGDRRPNWRPDMGNRNPGQGDVRPERGFRGRQGPPVDATPRRQRPDNR